MAFSCDTTLLLKFRSSMQVLDKVKLPFNPARHRHSTQTTNPNQTMKGHYEKLPNRDGVRLNHNGGDDKLQPCGRRESAGSRDVAATTVTADPSADPTLRVVFLE